VALKRQIETDKASIDVEAQDDGVMGKIIVRRIADSAEESSGAQTIPLDKLRIPP
jgi:hypothetical protein